MLDLRRLRVLRAVHHHGTVTAAAESLHLTPSAVSQQIRQLSRDLGVPLLEPEGRRIRLTSAAHVLLRHADAMTTRWEEAMADLAAHADGETGPLRMCGYPTGVATLLAPATALLRRVHPAMEVSVTEAEKSESFDLLLAEDADLAVVVPDPGVPPVDDGRFEQRRLVDDPQDLLVPAGHPLAGRASVRLAETAHEDWVVPHLSDCDYGRITQVACAAAGFAPRIVHRVTDWIAVSALVSNGLGVSLVPRLLPIAAEHDIARVRLSGDVRPARSILTVIRSGASRHPAVRRGLKALDQVVYRSRHGHALDADPVDDLPALDTRPSPDPAR
ncbi:LysR family transcriptional regulator [Nocardiopsis sediminis]|uniref:LysR family transcriptional regulator n=1 Tax=Nocardiopsis sediminis TaxID=1778267 RepID=A0ABV8FHR6_9ACTN